MGDPKEWRPSTGLGAIALGLFVVACTVMADQQHGVVRAMQFYGWQFGAVTFGSLALVHMLAASLKGWLKLSEQRALVREAWNKVTAQPALLIANAPTPPVIVTRQAAYNTASGHSVIEMRETKPVRWVLWQNMALAYCGWVKAKGGATSALLTGSDSMFPGRTEWVAATNGLRDGGMIEKVNGRSTEIADVQALAARVREGKCAWPTTFDPPAYRPAPAGVAEKLPE